MFENDLDKMLEALFADENADDKEEVMVLGGLINPLETVGNCCTYSYASYNG